METMDESREQTNATTRDSSARLDNMHVVKTSGTTSCRGRRKKNFLS